MMGRNYFRMSSVGTFVRLVRRGGIRWLFGATLLMVPTAPLRAWAQASPAPAVDTEVAAKQKARMLSDRATAEYRLGYYAEAARLYEDAYRTWNDPALLYNLGQAYRMNRESAKALVAYRSYVQAAPFGAPNVDLARKRVQELEASSSPPSVVVQQPLAPAALPPTTPASLVAAISSEPSAAGSAGGPADARRATRWWIWGGLGALVTGALVTGVLLANRAPEGARGSVGSAIVP